MVFTSGKQKWGGRGEKSGRDKRRGKKMGARGVGGIKRKQNCTVLRKKIEGYMHGEKIDMKI